MINSIATNFERKILFGFGRHFWNIIGVAGVITITAGGVSYLYSLTPSPQKVAWCDWISKRDSDYNCNSIAEELGGGATLYTPQNHKLYKDYLKYQASIPSPIEDKANKEKIMFSSLVAIGSGIGTIAVISVISAILALERNTRTN